MEIKSDLTTINHTVKASRNILGIVLHSMGGFQSGSIAWFKNPQAQASAHFCISKSGEIVRTVEEKNIAWHAGIFDEPIAAWLKPNPNNVTIGIELEDEKKTDWSYPQAQRDALRWLVDDLCRKYSIPKDAEHILLHKNLNPSRRSDPVGSFSLGWVLDGPVNPAPPADWILQNSDKWRGLCWYMNFQDPETTPLETIKSTIAGYKSRETDLKNQLEEVRKDNAVKDAEIINRKEQVSRLEAQLLQKDKDHKAEIEAIKAATPDLEKLTGEYKGKIRELEASIDEWAKKYGTVNLELAACRAGEQKTKSMLQAIIDFVKHYLPF